MNSSNPFPLQERIVKLEEQANSLYSHGDLEGAMDLYKECERLARELGDESSVARMLGNQGNVLTIRGQLDGALAVYRGI